MEQQQQQPQPQPHPAGGRGLPWKLAVGLAFITFNSGMAVSSSKGDATIVVFVATSYLDLVMLFCCLWLYQTAAPASPWRNRLKASVWSITTLLTFSFVYMIMVKGSAAGFTLPVATLVWIIAAATGVGAFTAFFDDDRVLPPEEAVVLAPV